MDGDDFHIYLFIFVSSIGKDKNIANMIQPVVYRQTNDIRSS